MIVKVLRAATVLFTGLLAGAFGYGAANLAPTFGAVPLEVRLTFHTALMKMNSLTMQATMAAAALSTLALAVMTRGRSRVIATAAGALVVTSFLVTRFGNVPINAQIKQWAVGTAPADYPEILRQWEMFNLVRTVTALIAFALSVYLVSTLRPAERPAEASAQARPGGR